jgi:hypothetical protein
MPQQPEFKTRLRFDPSRLSICILKRYLLDLLNDTEPDVLLSGDPPSQYTKDPDNLTDYRVLREMGLMAIKDWKTRLDVNKGDVDCLYLDDDMVATDARCFYESWKVIQEEVGNHEKQMSFFRLVSEIVANLSDRNYVDVNMEGEQRTIPFNHMEPRTMVPIMAALEPEKIDRDKVPGMKIERVVEEIKPRETEIDASFEGNNDEDTVSEDVEPEINMHELGIEW